jgi:uncharacterized membrane protein
MKSKGINQVGAYLIIALLVLIALSSFITLAEVDSVKEQNKSTSRATTLYDVRVYFHRNNILNTRYNETGSWITGLSDNESIEFELNPPLMGDLNVEGRDVGSSRKGFWIFLQILNPLGNTNADITFEIKEDDKIIAMNQNPISLGSNQQPSQPIMIPYLDSAREDYTFKSGSIIKVNIFAQVDGPLPVGITYDRGQNDGYLFFSCDQTSSEVVGSYDQDGTPNQVFYPNLPHASQRKMVFKGSVIDSFGGNDIERVEVAVDNILTRTGATYTSTEDDPKGQFELEYDYPKDLPSGLYFITAYFIDYSGNEHIATGDLTISKYGVYLECNNNTGFGFPDETLEFLIDVYNVGANSDSISLTPISDPTTWHANFQGGDTTGLIEPGLKDVKTLDVTVSSKALKNEECTVTVTGTSINDNEPPTEKHSLTPPISVVARAQFMFEFNILTDSSKTVSASESADYDVKLLNSGSEKDSYVVSVGEQPLSGSDWTATLATDSQYATKIDKFRYTVDLQETRFADFTLTVTAPDDENPSVTEMVLTISATSDNITGSSKTKSHETTTTLEGYIPPGEVTLSAKAETLIADPEDTIDSNAYMDILFELTAVNDDSVNDYYVELSIKNLPDNWIYLLNPSDFTVSVSGDEDFRLTLEIPETEAAGTYTIDINAKYSVENGNSDIQQSSISLTVTIPKVYAVELEADEKEQNIQMGKSVEYNVEVTDLGNVQNEEIEITVTELDHWEVDVSRTTIDLVNYGTVTNIKITVKPLSSADKNEKGIIDVKIESKETGEQIGEKLTLKTTLKTDTSEEVANFFYNYWFVLVMVIIIIILTFIIRARLK